VIHFPHLETNITTYCQNKCVGCNHLTPLVDKPAHLDPKIIERDLNIARNIMHANDYTLVGGEPTLHPAIMDIIGIVKRSDIADGMVIYTNGQSMRHLPDDFYREIDQLIVTPYKLDMEEINFIANKCDELNVKFERHTTTFTQAFYKKRHSCNDAEEIYRACWFRWNRRVIENGYFHRCCLSPFIPALTGGKHDGLALNGISENALVEYLNEPVPDICFTCGSNCGVPIGWKETTKENWIADSVV
jgi:GTP 3',8-cyclase